MCVCVFRGMQKRCINERGKRRMELISEEMCDWNQLTGVTVTPLTFEIIILGKSRQRRVWK